MASLSFSSLKMGTPHKLFLLPHPSHHHHPHIPLKIHCTKQPDHHQSIENLKNPSSDPKPTKKSESQSNQNKNILPPGPRKLPFIGNLHNMAGGGLPHRALAELSKRYGPIMHLQLGEVSTVVISSPELAQDVMKTYDHIFAQRPELLASKILTWDGSDIVFSNGEYWKQMRKVCVTELLGPKKVRSFASIREDEVGNIARTIRATAGTPFNFGEKIFWMTSVITCRAAFGDKWEDQQGVISLSRESLTLAGGFDLADVFPSLEFLHVITGMKPRMMKMRKKLDNILDKIIAQHKEKVVERSSGDQVVMEEEDLADVLLRLQASGNLACPISKDNVKAVIWDMFVAGTDTTSTTIEWLMSELMKNPRVLKKAQAEVREALKGKSRICEEDIQGLTYLKQVIRETLRVHPPVPLLIPRETSETWELNGYQIPYKTKIIINGWAIGRDPTYWEDAERFFPERFNDNSIDFKGFNFEYIPFGAGRRICPGMTFAVANIELPVSYLLNYFDWSLPDGVTPETLDMSEGDGVTAARKNSLFLVATPFVPSLDLDDLDHDDSTSQCPMQVVN